MVKKVNGKNSRSKRVKSKSLKKLVRSLRKQVKSRSRRRRQSKHGGAGAGEPPFKVGEQVWLVRNPKQEQATALETLRFALPRKPSLPAKWFIGKITDKRIRVPFFKQMYNVAYTEDGVEKTQKVSTNKTKMWHIKRQLPPWTPTRHTTFPNSFKRTVYTLMHCFARTNALPDDVLFIIIWLLDPVVDVVKY
jgi:hypothetical protein